MNEHKPWEFTCKTCGGHNLNVTHVWNILADLDSETWQEWGRLKSDHHWRFEFKEMVDLKEDEEAERGDFEEFAEDDSDSEPEIYETPEPESDPEGDEFYVNCTSCDLEIEFGWAGPERGGGIFPVECSDFVPGKYWPEPRYSDVWQAKNWLPKGDNGV